ncbi:hypothetical protein [Acidovorax sacchari]|uniref:hypothetical protein n=1 Tax=Acidovorax sacchari TaxID=3230736 RepID=UPI0039E32B96
MKTNNSELAHIRKILPFGIPVMLMLLGVSSYFTFWSIPELFGDLSQPAPVVRIWPGVMLAPAMLPLALLTLIILPMKAVPLGEQLVAKGARLVNILVVVNLAALLLVAFASTVLQNHYLPRLGYAKCQELKGQPSLWFNDWVRDSAWCVQGKSLEWVKEQARLSTSITTR